MSEPDTLMAARTPTGLVRALAWLTLTVGVAAAAVSYSYLRENAGPLDPYTLLMRFMGFAATLRALIAARDLWPRLRMALRRSRYTLSLSEDTLTLTGGSAPQSVALCSVARVVETPSDGVWLILRGDSAPSALALPPLFASDEGALAELLMRAMPAPAVATETAPEAPPGLPSLRYDDAAAGKPVEGALVLAQGLRWARRGPYAAPLFALTLASTMLAAPGDFAVGPVFAVLLLACLAAPTLWLLSVRRSMLPRKGIALLLTPEEALLRTRSGVVRAPYASLLSVRVERAAGWTLLEGSRPHEKLVLEREDDLPIRYDAGFFRWPADVVAQAIDAYRAGALP